MRLIRLLVVVVVVLIVGRTAAAQDTTAPSSPKSDYVRPVASQGSSTGATANALPRLHSSTRRRMEVQPHDAYCLTMHTLQVARVDGTDNTYVVGDRTCTPARNFQTKSAVATPKQ